MMLHFFGRKKEGNVTTKQHKSAGKKLHCMFAIKSNEEDIANNGGALRLQGSKKCQMSFSVI